MLSFFSLRSMLLQRYGDSNVVMGAGGAARVGEKTHRNRLGRQSLPNRRASLVSHISLVTQVQRNSL